MKASHPIRVIAIDWSGAKVGERNKIWLAEVVEGRMVRLESGRTREEVIAHLVSEMSPHQRMIVGLDFAFSFPAWFCRELGVSDGSGVWRVVAERGEGWLGTCPRPFWGRPGKKRPDLLAHFRDTETHAASELGSQPKSVFQIGGGGAVGTGSIRGMPHLEALRTAGFSIWPFQSPGLPMALEIYPRTLTGPVVKSDAGARAAYLEGRFPELSVREQYAAAGSEDAFDAAVSAVVMSRCLDDILALTPPDDPVARLEGAIWSPAASGALDRVPVRPPGRESLKDTLDCPFCTVAEARAVATSRHGLAVTDGFPLSRGHTLVVPREHVASIFDLSAEAQQDLWMLVGETRRLLEKRHQPHGFTVGINDGTAAGQTVPHAHIHVIPRYEGDVLDPRGGIRWVIPAKAEYWDP